MSRTNSDQPDVLVNELMRGYGLPTKRSAVEFALRRLLESRMTEADLEAMVGVGWEGDLNAMRRASPPDVTLSSCIQSCG